MTCGKGAVRGTVVFDIISTTFVNQAGREEKSWYDHLARVDGYPSPEELCFLH